MQTMNAYDARDIYSADGEPDQAFEMVAARMADLKYDIIHNADASVKGPYQHWYECYR